MSDKKKVTLNGDLLEVLCLLKAKEHTFISEGMLGKKMGIEAFNVDWTDQLREYFQSLPECLIEDLGLDRSEKCFSAICSLKIPDRWVSTPYEKLSMFQFAY